MENALLIGLSRQIALQRELDVVANNIANINTTGFKTENSKFEEYLMPVARENRFQAPDRRLSFVLDRGTWHNMRQGSIETTGNPLDVTIDGNAFLVVQTPAGERYTRNGALQVNAQGQIVTADGSPVLGDNGPIVLQQLDRNLSISADGRISVVEGNENRTESLRGKLRLVSFANPQQLQKDGANNFRAPAGVAGQPATNFRLIQGAVEKSNVNGVYEMTRMIEITRTYTNVASMLQQQGDLRRSAIEKLAEVPA
jgi:flagellar basal-body rod protein FlgF/flagellar basal-body rod protein FlgG